MRSWQWVSSLKTASTAAVYLPAQPTLADHECLTTRSARVFAGRAHALPLPVRACAGRWP